MSSDTKILLLVIGAFALMCVLFFVYFAVVERADRRDRANRRPARPVQPWHTSSTETIIVENPDSEVVKRFLDKHFPESAKQPPGYSSDGKKLADDGYPEEEMGG